jgi:hypothetical protein
MQSQEIQNQTCNGALLAVSAVGGSVQIMRCLDCGQVVAIIAEHQHAAVDALPTPLADQIDLLTSMIAQEGLPQ